METRRNRIVLGAILLAVTVATACLPAPSAWVVPADPRAHVAVIGDSLTFRAEYGPGLPDTNDPATPRDLTGAPVEAGFGASISALTGATTADLATLPTWPEPVAEVVVIALGTNDRHGDAVPLHESIADLDAYLARWPDACVVLVTIVETPVWELDVYGPPWNAALEERADVVADWAAVTEAHPEYLLESDLVHHTPEGAAAYRELIMSSAETCVTGPPAV